MKFLAGTLLGIALAIGSMAIPGSRDSLLNALARLTTQAEIPVLALPEERADQDTTWATNSDAQADETITEILKSARHNFAVLGTTADTGALDTVTSSIADPAITEVALTDASPLDLRLDFPLDFPLESALDDEPPSTANDNESVALPRFDEEENLFQVAWTPFRSETSAKGFAAQLQQQLAREFLVVKTGPGRYEVGFEFSTQDTRSEVLRQITKLTGYQTAAPPRVLQI